jgi:hypothetical protein
VRPAAKPAQVPKGTFPTPLEPVKAPGRVSGEAASTDVPRGAHSAREQRHRLRASSGRPVPRRNPEPDEAIGASRKGSPTLETGPRFPRAGPLGLARRSTRKRQAHGLDSPGRTPNRPHTMRRGPVANPAEEGRRRNRMRPERRTRVRAPCPEPVIRVPVRGRGWRSVRCPRRQAGRHRARTGPEGHRAGSRDPNQAVVLHEEDRPPGPSDMLRGRSPSRHRPCKCFRRSARESGDRTQIASEPDHPANAPQPCGVRTVPRTVPSRVNAEGGSRACVFRRRAADPKACAAIRRKMLAPTLSRTDFTVFCFC